jgi:hypothetical protein
MLPSGNDAAMALAEYFGQMLLDIRIEEQKKEDERREAFALNGIQCNVMKQ